jgi:hypothetical protein
VRARDVQAVGALDLRGLDMGSPEEQHSGSMWDDVFGLEQSMPWVEVPGLGGREVAHASLRHAERHLLRSDEIARKRELDSRCI